MIRNKPNNFNYFRLTFVSQRNVDRLQINWMTVNLFFFLWHHLLYNGIIVNLQRLFHLNKIMRIIFNILIHLLYSKMCIIRTMHTRMTIKLLCSKMWRIIWFITINMIILHWFRTMNTGITIEFLFSQMVTIFWTVIFRIFS